MKNYIAASLFAFALIPAAFGAANDTLISFATRGPDKYQDGVTVLDGECYALVWTRTGETFAGFAADGTAAGDESEVLVFAPLAKGGRCPTTVFEIDAALEARYRNGTYGVYLVDTRLASGQLGGVNAKGLPVAVNGYGEVTEGSALGVPTSAVAVTTRSEIPEGTPRPTITAVRVVGDNVFLTVKNTVPCLQYAAREEQVGGGRLKVEGEGALSPATQGYADAEITVIVPKKGDSGFYSVERK